MKILAIIPARAGSKRVIGKNLKWLKDKPLIAWTLDSAVGSPDICDRLVSTDSEEIAEFSLSCGAIVPWLRPAVLSGDEASSIDVILHALDWYETNVQKVDGVLMLQPTSPFRLSQSIAKSIELFKSEGGRCSVVSVSKSSAHPDWTYKVVKKFMEPYIVGQENIPNRSQDLVDAYTLNGSIYLCSPSYLQNNKTFIGQHCIPLIISSQKESLDIDTEWDWMLAEWLACNEKK
jgi:N-acylneuraminate cytidylyltransferase